MTLILNAVGPRCAVHASDRLISKQIRGAPDWSEVDPHTNKTVIVVAGGCWLVIGYTGRAFFSETPTDQLIAQAIAQDFGSHEFFIGANGFDASGVDYREIVRRISSTLLSRFQWVRPSGAAHDYVVFTGAGFQDTPDGGGRQIQFATTVDKGGAHTLWRTRRRHSSAHYTKIETSGWIDSEVRTEVNQVLANPGGTPEVLREQLINVVSNTARRPIPVGENIMSVVLYPWEGRGSIKFHAGTPESQAKIGRLTRNLDAPAPASIYTPYLLMHGVIFPPAIVIGSGRFYRDNIFFDVSGLDPPQPTTEQSIRHQPRIRPPRR